MSEVKFIPPQLNLPLTRFLQIIWHGIIWGIYRIRLVIAQEDLDRAQALVGERVVYLPNHSNLDDAIVIFGLSARLRQLFNYVVAYEAFRGWLGKLLPKVGAYSIRRGLGDRHSIVQTLNILQQPRCKLVIFPEGGCSYQNDTVIPFRSGAVELAFKAMAKLATEQAIPDFWLVPVSLKYSYGADSAERIAQALDRLEDSLGLESNSELEQYSRLRQIAERVLENMEAEYGLVTAEATSDWNERLEQLRHKMLAYCETSLQLEAIPHTPSRERVYKIQSVLSSLTPEHNQHLALTAVRLLNFDAIYDGYVAEKPTSERYLATIDRLEREVFQIDRPKYKGPRTVRIKLGEPINLKQYWSIYLGHELTDVPSAQNKSYSLLSQPKKLSSRQEVIEHLTTTVQEIVQTNLD